MFLFEGAFGRILHTGDFRWELARQQRLLAHPALTRGLIDKVHLDNTYCHPECVRLAGPVPVPALRFGQRGCAACKHLSRCAQPCLPAAPGRS